MSNKIFDIKERTFQFSKQIIFLIQEIDYARKYDSIFNQLLRSATSVGANVAEGKSGSSKNDFLKFQIIALKSANETKYWLRLIKESLPVNEKKFDDLINEIDEISKVLATIIIKNKGSDL
ncbi:four helix bundle protein [Chryseobacterium taeanense]|uniref:four helix bundle protein n=1 Tax=Chryseobacterium taeanense TaxID=311334 RepID=UPI000DB3E848|nr:MAG: four helix bundle protein [Chryseobacterium sp.]